MSNEKNLFEALAEAQKEIIAPEKDAEGQFQNRYASIHGILKSCRVALANHGLTLDSSAVKREEGWVLITSLYYKDQSHSIEMPLMVEKQSAQGFASALTYARRYSISCILSLPSDEDDDAGAAEKESPHAQKVQKVQKAPNANTASLSEKKFWETIKGVWTGDNANLRGYVAFMAKARGKSLDQIYDLAIQDLDAFFEEYEVRTRGGKA